MKKVELNIKDSNDGLSKMDSYTSSGGRRISYYYHPEIGNFHYGVGHPMKPHRVRLAHQLITDYGLHNKMKCLQPTPISDSELTRFHTDDYVNFLRSITPYNMQSYVRQLQRFNVGEDCPVFDGLYDYVRIYASGSISGAGLLNDKSSDIVINWSGGLHHAKKSEASGFCYVNDCVLGIIELLKQYTRVCYIDIDIHHGDGVEEAFYTTNRVMTVSFHKFGDYFPGTGNIEDIGLETGKGYAVNVPFDDGIDDITFISVFKQVMDKVMECYQPQAFVLQCGADSLSGDRLGCFNLSLKGHAGCVNHVKSYGVPILVLGGGGYTMRNVARCWTYETSVLLGLGDDIHDRLPDNEYLEYFGPDYKLQISTSNMENMNKKEDIETKIKRIYDHLESLESVPGIEVQTGSMLKTPPAFFPNDPSAEKDKENPNERPKSTNPVSEKEFY